MSGTNSTVGGVDSTVSGMGSAVGGVNDMRHIRNFNSATRCHVASKNTFCMLVTGSKYLSSTQVLFAKSSSSFSLAARDCALVVSVHCVSKSLSFHSWRLPAKASPSNPESSRCSSSLEVPSPLSSLHKGHTQNQVERVPTFGMTIVSRKDQERCRVEQTFGWLSLIWTLWHPIH